MTSESCQQKITTHILPNISQSKDNQTLKLRQAIGNNNRKFFHQMSFTKGGRETSSTPLFVF